MRHYGKRTYRGLAVSGASRLRPRSRWWKRPGTRRQRPAGGAEISGGATCARRHGTDHSRNASGDGQEPEEALDAAVCAVRRSGERRAEDDEERRGDEGGLAANSVAQEADRNLAKDSAWEGSRGERPTGFEQTLWSGRARTDEQCVGHAGRDDGRVVLGIQLLEHDLCVTERVPIVASDLGACDG